MTLPLTPSTGVRKVDGRSMRQPTASWCCVWCVATRRSRAEIARQTGLSPAAVSGIVERLLDDALAVEDASAEIAGAAAFVSTQYLAAPLQANGSAPALIP